MQATPIDVFLSYNTSDRDAVRHVQRLLQARGITTFLDRDDLVAGLPWPEALEQGLREVRAVAVFIGRQLGDWQKREMWFALDRQIRESKQGRAFPVIPVLLCGADLTPSFLFLHTWIDLRSGIDSTVTTEALDAFEGAIRGMPPDQLTERTVVFCPYRGLQAFREEDAAFFAGREAFSKRLLEFTLRKELVAVVGPSGSGKSSVVQAGLLPLLRRQRPPDKTWDAITFTPGQEPFHRLASALILVLEPYLAETKRLQEAQQLGESLAHGRVKIGAVIDRVIEKSNGTGRLLVVADQFEELFTLTRQPNRGTFAEALLGALGRSPFTLLVTLRADFYSQAIGLSRELSDRLPPAQENIGAMTVAELKESITKPAELVGLRFEPGLVERILTDVGIEPGYLPLVEFSLTELWRRRQGTILTNQAYNEIEGVAGALARRAEIEFAKFTPVQHAAARRLFSRLVRVAKAEEAGEDTRQRVDLAGADAITQDVVQVLAHPDVRLLVTARDEETDKQLVEVVHEALIRNWQRLRDWVNGDRDFLLWRQRLNAHLAEWRASQSSEEALLPKAFTAEAASWLKTRAEELYPEEKQLIEASRTHQMQEEERLQRLRGETQRARDLALARQLAAQSELARNDAPYFIQRSILLAIESVRAAPLFENNLSLRRGLSLLPKLVSQLQHRGPIVAVAFSPDGRYVATGSGDKTACVFEAVTGREMARLEHEASVNAVALSADGTYVATGSDDRTARLFESGKEISRLQHQGPVVHVALSPTGRYLATSSEGKERVFEIRNGTEVSELHHIASVMAFSPDGRYIATENSGTVWVFETESAKDVSRLQHAMFMTVNAVAFSPDGHYIAVGYEEVDDIHFDGDAAVFETKDGRKVAWLPHEMPVRDVAFSPDGRYVATGSHDYNARVFEVKGERQVLELHHSGSVHHVAFSPDGRYIATQSADNMSRVFEVKRGREVSRLEHSGSVVAVGFSPVACYLAMASMDGSGRVFEVKGEREVSRLEHKESIRAVAFSPDGRYVATGSDDCNARVFEVKSGKEISRLEHRGKVMAVAFSPDGRYVATGSRDKTARVFEAERGREVSRLEHPWGVKTVSFSSDSRYVTTGRRVFEVESGTEMSVVEHPEGRVLAVAFSPDGQYVATGSDDRTARVIGAWGGKEISRLQHQGPVIAVSFSSGGRYVATGSADGTARVFEAASGKEISRLEHQALVSAVAFSPDDCYLATGSWDKTARVFEAETGKEISRVEQLATVEAVSFEKPGKYLLLGVKAHNIVTVQRELWRTEDLVSEACSHLTRNFTHEEWRQYFDDEPYRKTCPNLPEGD